MGVCSSKKSHSSDYSTFQTSKSSKNTYIPKTSNLENLVVITAIFNPNGYKKRHDLYFQFEKKILQAGNENNFAVTSADNPNHIQLKTKVPLWHKENLLNIAISRLPETYKYILWLDADIEFVEKDWPERILKAFEKYQIIQVFKYANFLGPDNSVLETYYSFAYAVVNELPIDRKNYNEFYPHPGYGWGITIEAFKKLQGLIDFCIIGSGDVHMAFSLINRLEESFAIDISQFHPSYIIKLKEWSKIASQFTKNNQFGFADCVIKHFFHGYREDRKYVDRMKLLCDFSFDPFSDVVYEPNGVIQIKNKKELESAIANYFSLRNEDENKMDPSKMSTKIVKRTPEEILKRAQNLKVNQAKKIAHKANPKQKHQKKNVNVKQKKAKGKKKFKIKNKDSGESGEENEERDRHGDEHEPEHEHEYYDQHYY